VPNIQSFGLSDGLVRPPHGYGSGDATAWKRVAIGVASATFDLFGAIVVGAVVFSPTVDCYVRAGAVASANDATANDFPMLAGWFYKWMHLGAPDRYVSVLRKSADGFLYYYTPGSS
jgi:hypothetical protein